MLLQAKPYEWMVKYTPQRVWINGRGVLLWLAYFFGDLGGAMYLISLYFNNLTGMAIGWGIIILLNGGCHLAFLGRPLRVWRAFTRPQSSWITRGLIFIVGFVVFGALQLAPALPFLAWLPWSIDSLVLRTIAAIFAFLILFYSGFAMSVINAISFWNHALLPVLFAFYGFLGAAGLFLIVVLSSGMESMVGAVETGIRILLVVAAVLLAVYLGSATSTPGGKQSVAELIRGHISIPFYVGLVVLGIVIPLIVSVYFFSTGVVAPSVLIAGVICEVIGSLSLRYCMLKGGIYTPIIPNRLEA
jgi:formate-dependent nitrite reductase membrane component NrfD